MGRPWPAPVVVLVAALTIAGTAPLATLGAANGAAAEGTPAVDVVFVVDRTPSTNDPKRNNTTAAAVGFAKDLEAYGADGRYAVVGYASADWTTLESNFTTDVGAVRDALSTMHRGEGTHENASVALLTALEDNRSPSLGYRDGAVTVVVLFTSGDDDGYCQLGSEAIAAVDDHEALLVSVAADPPEDNGKPAEGCLENGTTNDLRTIAQEQVEDGFWIPPADPDFTPVFEWLGLLSGDDAGADGGSTDNGTTTDSGGNSTDNSTSTGSGGNTTDNSTSTGSGGNTTDDGTSVGSGGNSTDNSTNTGSGGNTTDDGTSVGSGGNSTDNSTSTGSGGNTTDDGTTVGSGDGSSGNSTDDTSPGSGGNSTDDTTSGGSGGTSTDDGTSPDSDGSDDDSATDGTTTGPTGSDDDATDGESTGSADGGTSGGSTGSGDVDDGATDSSGGDGDTDGGGPVDSPDGGTGGSTDGAADGSGGGLIDGPGGFAGDGTAGDGTDDDVTVDTNAEDGPIDGWADVTGSIDQAGAEARFVVLDATIEPRTAAPGERVGVTVVVANEGHAHGWYHARLRTVHDRLDDRWVSLAPGESYRFSWSVRFDEPGYVRLFLGDRFLGQVVVTAAASGGPDGTGTRSGAGSSATPGATVPASDAGETGPETTPTAGASGDVQRAGGNLQRSDRTGTPPGGSPGVSTGALGLFLLLLLVAAVVTYGARQLR